MNYRKRPIIVEAVQWTGSNYQEIEKFLEGADKVLRVNLDDELKLISLNGYMSAAKGFYIVRTGHKEVYPVSEANFNEIYEAVE